MRGKNKPREMTDAEIHGKTTTKSGGPLEIMAGELDETDDRPGMKVWWACRPVVKDNAVISRIPADVGGVRFILPLSATKAKVLDVLDQIGAAVECYWGVIVKDPEAASAQVSFAKEEIYDERKAAGKPAATPGRWGRRREERAREAVEAAGLLLLLKLDPMSRAAHFKKWIKPPDLLADAVEWSNMFIRDMDRPAHNGTPRRKTS